MDTVTKVPQINITQGNSQAPITPSSEQQVPVTPGNKIPVNKSLNVDIFKSNLLGMSYESIASAIKPTDNIMPLYTEDKYWKDYGEKLNVTSEAFHKMYLDAEEKYKYLKDFTYDNSINPVGSEVVGVGLGTNPYFGRMGNNIMTNENSEIYQPFMDKNFIQTETPEQNAARKGYYYNFKTEVDPDTGKIKNTDHVKIDGRMKHSFFGGNYYYVVPEKDKNGDPILDKYGRQSYAYEQDDDFSPKYDVRKVSLLGQQKMYGQSLLAPLIGLVEGATVKSVQGIIRIPTGLADLIATSVGKQKHMTEDEINAKHFSNKIRRHLDNVIIAMDALKWVPSKEFQIDPNKVLGMAYQLGTIGGYMFSGQGVAKSLSKVTSSRVLIKTASSIVGSSQFTNDIYIHARSAGYDIHDAAVFATVFAPATFAFDYILQAPWLTKGLGTDINKQMGERIVQTVGEFKKVGANVKDPGIMMKIGKKVMGTLSSDPLFVKGVTKKAGYVAKGILKAGHKSGTNLAVITAYENMLQHAADDGVFGKYGLMHKKDDEQLFHAPPTFSKEAIKGYMGSYFIGALTGGMMDAFNSKNINKYRQTIQEEVVVSGKTSNLIDWYYKAYDKGMMGRDYIDVEGNAIKRNEDGSENGATINIENDISYDDNGTKRLLFKKGEVLKTEADRNLHDALSDLIISDDIARRFGIKDPGLLYGLTGQRLLLIDGVEIGRKISEKQTEINTFKSQETELAKDGKSSDEIKTKIELLENEVNGEFDADGKLIKKGLKQDLDYIIKPKYKGERGFFSEAAIDKFKSAAVNGVMLQIGKGRAHVNNNTIKFHEQFTKGMEDVLSKLKIYREEAAKSKIENIQKQAENIGNLSDAIKSLTKNVKIGASEEVTGNLRDISSSMKALQESFDNYGAEIGSLNKIVGEVSKLSTKYNKLVIDLFKKQGIDFTGDFTESLAFAGKQLSDVENADFLKSISEPVGSLEDIVKSSKERVKKGFTTEKYSPEDDAKFIENYLFGMNQRGRVVNFMDILDFYKKSKKLDDINVITDLDNIKMKANEVNSMIDWLDSWNNVRESFPEYDPLKTILQHEPGTKVNDGSVEPGFDVPTDVLDNLKSKLKDVDSDINKLLKKAGVDINDSKKIEIHRRKINYINKYQAIGDMIYDQPELFGFLQKENAAAFKLFDKIESVDKISDEDFANFRNIIDTMEDKIYEHSRNNKDFKGKIFEHLLNQSGASHRTLGTSNYNYIEKDDGNVLSVNDIPISALGASIKTKDGSSTIMDPREFRFLKFLRNTHYLNMITAIKTGDFYSILKSIKKDKIPGIEQIDAIRSTVSMAIGRDITPGWDYMYTGLDGQYGSIEDITSRTENKKNGKTTQTYLRSLLIDGSGGTGKTTVVSDISAKMIDKYLEKVGAKKDIIIIAPSEENVTNIKKSYSGLKNLNVKDAMTYKKFIKEHGRLSSDKNTLFVIDEFQRIEKEMAKVLRSMMLNKSTYVMFGDVMQAVKREGQFVDNIGYAEELSAVAPRMETKFRTGIASIGKVNEAISLTLKGRNTAPEITFPIAVHNANNTKGVNYFISANDVIDAWKKDAIQYGDERILIFGTKSEADSFKKSLSDDLKKFKDNVRYVIDESDGISDDNGSVLGLEYPNVYVAIEDIKNVGDILPDDVIYRRKLLLTAEGRAQNFVAMPAYGRALRLNTAVPDNMIIDQTESLKNEETNRSKSSNEFIESSKGREYKYGQKTPNEDTGSEAPIGTLIELSEKPVITKKKPIKKKIEKVVTKKKHELLGKTFKPKGINEGRLTVVKVGMKENEVSFIKLSNGREYISESDNKLLRRDALDLLTNDMGEPVNMNPDEWNKINEAMIDEFKSGHVNPNVLKFSRAAKIYEEDGMFPIHTLVSEVKGKGKKYFANDFLNKFRKRELITGDYDLKFRRKIKLYTRNDETKKYEPIDHYGVITIESNGEVVGILPAPAKNYDEIIDQNREFSTRHDNSSVFTEKNLSKNKDSVSFEDPITGVKSSLTIMHKDLIELVTRGYESGEDSHSLGTVTFSDPRGARPVFGESRSLNDFLSDAENSGLSIKKSGNDIRILQYEQDGKLKWGLEASYIDNNGEPLYSALIPISPGVVSDFESLIKSIKGLEDFKGENNFLKELSANKAYQTLRSNSNLFFKDNGTLFPEYSDFLVKGKEGNRPVVDISGKGKWNDSKILDNLKSAIKQLEKFSSTGVDVKNWAEMRSVNQGGESLSYITPDKTMTTNVSEVIGPNYSVHIDPNESTKNGITGITSSNTNSNIDDMPFRTPKKGEALTLVANSEIISEARHIFGESYTDEFLSFSSEKKFQGKEYLGYVNGLKLVLRSEGGITSREAFRHETVHVITKNILSPEVAGKLYNDVRRYTGDEKLSNNEADEVLASLHESGVKLSSKNIIGRFLDWLSNMFHSIKSSAGRLNDFYAGIDAGYYKDLLDASSRPENDDVSLMSEETRSGKKNYLKLARKFGGSDMLARTSDFVLGRVKNWSAVSNVLDGNSRNIPESVAKAQEDINDYVNRKGLSEKFGEVKSLDDAYKLYPVKNEGDIDELSLAEGMAEKDYSLYLLSKGRNFETIAQHLFPRTDLRSDEMTTLLTRVYDGESSEVDPEKFVSDFTKQFLRTIPLHNFGKTGKITGRDSGNNFVDYNLLKLRVSEAIRATKFRGKTNLNSLFLELDRMANQYSGAEYKDDISRNSILSFLYYYGNMKNNTIGLTKDIQKSFDISNGTINEAYPIFSHNMFANKLDLILSKIDAIDPNAIDFRNSIIQKSKYSSQLLNAMYSTFYQHRINFYTSQVQRFGNEIYFTKNVFRETSSSAMKRDIRSEIDSRFYTPEGGVSDKGFNSVTRRKGINFTKDNISYAGFGDVLKRSNNGWRFVNKDIEVQKTITERMLHYLGIGGIKSSTVHNIFVNKDIMLRHHISKDGIADYLGNMIAAIHNGRVNDSGVDARLKSFARSKGIEKEGDIVASDFFPFIDMLADIQGYITARVSPNISMTVKGKTRNNMLLPSALLDSFTNNQGEVSCNKLVRYVTGEINKLSTDEVNKNHLVTINKDGSKSFTNPLFDSDSPLEVQSVEQINGILDSFYGKESGDLTSTDYINLAIHSLFKNSVMRGGDQIIEILPENLGDSKVLPYFNIRFSESKNPIINITSKEGVRVVTIDDKAINNYIDYGFKQARKAKLASLYRLAQYFNKGARKLVDIDTNMNVEDQESFLNGSVSEMKKRLARDSRDGIDISYEMKANGLFPNRDFVIGKNGRVYLGVDAEMKLDIYNAKNYELWHSGKDRTKIRDRIFLNRWLKFTKMMKENVYNIPADIAEAGQSYTEVKPGGEKLLTDINGNISTTREYNWHPFYKGFFYLDHIAKKFIMEPIAGNEAQFKDSVDKSKRNKLINSSGRKPVVGEPWTLPEKSYTVTLSDRKDLKEYLQLKELSGSGDYLNHESMEFTNPLHHSMLVNSLGGEFAIANFNDKTNKTVHVEFDVVLGQQKNFKYAQVPLNEDIINGSEMGARLFKKIMTRDTSIRNLYEDYLQFRKEGSSFEEAIDKLHTLIASNPELHDAYTSIISWESSNKPNIGNVNDMTLEEYIESDNVLEGSRDNSRTYYQLNLNRDNQTSISRGNQNESEIVEGGTHNVQRAAIIDVSNRQIFLNVMKDIQKREAGNLKSYLFNLGMSAAESMDMITKTGELFASGIDVSLPIIQTPAMQAFVSEINKAINPREVGSLNVQMPSDFTMHLVKDDLGNEYYTTYSERGDSKKERGLQHYRFYDKDKSEVTFADYDGNYQKDIDDLNSMIAKIDELKSKPQTSDTEAKIDAIDYKPLLDKITSFYDSKKIQITYVKPSEVATNYQFKEEFGISNNETLDDVLTINIDGKKVNVRAWLKNKLGMDYYNNKKRRTFIENDFLKFLDEAKNVKARGISGNESIKNYYKAFLETLLTHSERIPTSGYGSGAAEEVVRFANNSGNIKYISSERNVLTNADYDIDELHTYIKKPIIREGETIPEIDIPDYNKSSFVNFDNDQIMNIKHDVIYDAFTDPRNLDLLVSPVDVGKLREIVKYDKNYNNDFSSTVDNFIASKEGKDMISRFANAIHTYMMMKRLNPNLYPGFKFDNKMLRNSLPDYEFILKRTASISNSLYKLLQAAVDNPKEMILGYLNMNRTSGNIVTALALSNKNLVEIGDFLNNKIVKDVIKETAHSESIGVKTKNILDVIDQKIRDLDEMFLNTDPESRIKERSERIEYSIKKLMEEKDSKILETIEPTEQAEIDLDGMSEGVDKMLEDIKDKAKENYDLNIDEQIANLRDKLLNNPENVKKYEDNLQTSAQNNIALLDEMKSMYYKGTWLYRLSTALSLYTQISAKSYDRYFTTKNLEFIMGQSLDSYADNKKNYDGWINRALKRPGQDVQNFSFTTKQEVDHYIGTLAEKMKAELDPGNFEFIVGSGLGVERAFYRSLSDFFKIDINTTKGSSNRDEHGRLVHNDFEKTNATSGKNLRYINARNSDATINIDATTSNTDQIHAKGVINIRANKNDLVDNSEGLDKIIKQIKKVQRLKKGKVTINLTGSDEFTLKTQLLTDYERMVDIEQNIRKIGNIAEIYHSLPTIDSYINALRHINDVESTFFNKSKFVKSFAEKIIDINNLDYLSAKQFVSFEKAVNGTVLDMYYRDFGMSYDLNEYYPSETGDKIDRSVDLSDYNDRRYFVSLFPEIIKRVQEDASHPLNKNLFIRNLNIENGILKFNKTLLDNNNSYRKAFGQVKDIDPNLWNMFGDYELLKRGFEFSSGGWRDLIGGEFYRSVSNYIKAIEPSFAEKTGNKISDAYNDRIRKEFSDNFVTNVINSYPELAPYVNNPVTDPGITEGITPEYIRSREILPNGKSRVVLLKHVSGKNYEPVYKNATSMLRTIPSERSIETRYEVIRPKSPEDIETLRSNNKVIHLHFATPHNYKSGKVVVDNMYADLSVIGPRDIRLSVSENNPQVNSAAEKLERSMVSSVEKIVKVLDIKSMDIDHHTGNGFTFESGNTILYNPRYLRPDKSTIGDLDMMLVGMLKDIDSKYSDSFYKDILKISNDYNIGKVPDDVRVLRTLRNEGLFVDNKTDMDYINGARRVLVDEIGNKLAGVLVPENITFDSTLHDLLSENNIRKAIKDKYGADYYNELTRFSKQKSSRMDSVSDHEAQRLLNNTKKQFGIDGEVINISQAKELLGTDNVPVGFSIDGKSYIVSGKAHSDTPMHEALHPFIDALEKSNPAAYKSLIKDLQSSYDGNSEIYKTEDLYPELSNDDKLKEALVSFVGRVSSGKRLYSIPESMNLFKRIWSSLGDIFRRVFGPSIDIAKLSPNITIAELSKRLARGDKVRMNEMKGQKWEQRTIEDNSDLVDQLLIPASEYDITMSIKNRQFEGVINNFYDKASRNKDKSVSVYDPDIKQMMKISFKDVWDQGHDTVKSEMRKILKPFLNKSDSAISDQLTRWLDNSSSEGGFGSLKIDNLNKFFKPKKSRNLLFSPETLKKFKNQISYSKATKVVRLSKFNDYFKGTKFGNVVDSSLFDKDPFVIIHRIVESGGQVTGIDASLYNINFVHDRNFGQSGEGLFMNFMNNSEARNNGMDIPNTIDNVRRLQLTLIAMRLKQAGINIGNIGTMNMNRSSFGIKMVDPTVFVPIAKKLPEIMDIGEPLMKILSDPTVTDPSKYIPDYSLLLRNNLIEQIRTTGKKVSAKLKALTESDIDVLDKYLNHEGSESEYIEMLEERRRYLDSRSDLTTIDKKAANEEYRLLSEIIGELKGFKRDPFRKVVNRSDSNFFDGWVSSLHDQQNEVIQDFGNIIRSKSAEITGMFHFQYKDELKSWFEKLRPIWRAKTGVDPFVKSRVSETFHKLFEPLMIKKTFKGSDGKFYEMNTNELRLNYNDEARKLGISKEEIDFSNWVADIIDKNIKDVIRQNALKKGGDYYTVTDKGERFLDKKKLNEYVEQQYNLKWKRGMLPIMYKTANQNLFEGSVGQAFSKFFKRGKTPVEMYDQVLELTDESATGNVRSHFAPQYLYGDPTEFGTDTRMRHLGLMYGKESEPIVRISENYDGVKVNKDINTNLEDVLDYFVMDAMWKNKMETDVLPEFNSALVRLKASEMMYGRAQKLNEDGLKVMFDKTVQGKHQLEFNNKTWENVAAVSNIIYKLTSFTGVALSIPVAITSGIGNLTELNLHALASSVANPYDTFNFKELTRAKLAMIKESRKVTVLTRHYQISEMEKFDSLMNQKHKLSKNTPLNHRSLHYLNWLTDFSVRQAVMVAQMMHDGTWDAHTITRDGNVEYNAHKDKRFFTLKDGKYVQSDKQKALMTWVRRNLLKDGRVFNQDKSELPLRAYDLQDQRKFEWIASEFVTGTYNQESTGKYDSFILGKLVMQFKKYLISKAELRLGNLTNITKKGVYKIKAEGGYKVIIEQDGKLHEVWHKLDTEGAYVTVAKWMAHDIFAPLFKGHPSDIQFRWNDLDPIQKYNFVRTAQDALLFSAIYMLFTGIGKYANLTPEDKKKYGNLVNMRAIASVQRGLMTSLALTPRQLMSSMGLPALGSAKRLINIIFMNGTKSDIRNSLPFGATYQTFDQIINNTNNDSTRF